MVSQLNCLEMISRVRRRIEDRDASMFTDEEVLEALDETLAPIFADLRMAGRYYDLDSLTIPFSTFTQVEENTWEADLPEYVGDVLLVEGQRGGQIPITVQRAQLHERNVAREFLSGKHPLWYWSEFNNPGKFRVSGNFVTMTEVQVWFMRRWPPLHYSFAGPSSTSTVLAVLNPTGDFVNVDDYYIGMKLEITAASNAAHVGLRRRIVDSVGRSTLTLDSALPFTPTSTTQWALISPLSGQYNELHVAEAANALLMRLGNVNQASGMFPWLQHLRNRFQMDVRLRDTSQPRRVSNDRVLR